MSGRAALLLAVLTLAACSDADVERRAREAAQKVKESMPDVQAVALAQNASPDDVKLAQNALHVVNEYQGEINGKLDRVTVNAIQAFQRSNGIEDDGILNDKTLAALRQVVSG